MRERLVQRFFGGVGIVATFCALAPSRPASAQDTDKWIVAEISGQAREHGQDGTWHPLERGSVLDEGRAVETGPDAKLVVMHGKDLVTVSPNSAFQIPRNSNPATGASFVQTLGTLMFRIEHSVDRRFEVDAPHLASVVKGTVFTVSVSDAADSVHVAEGAVQVTTSLSHEVSLVRPGQTAVVSLAGRDLTVLGGANSASHPQRRSENIDPTDDKSSRGRGHGVAELTRTVGEEHVDIAKVTKGLLGEGGASNAPGQFARRSSGNQDGSSQSNANAAGGNPNAAGGNPNARGGNPNAAGGNANAGGGNPNAGGGNPNAGGGKSKSHGKS